MAKQYPMNCTHLEISHNWLCSCGYRLKSIDHDCQDPVAWCHECGHVVDYDESGVPIPTTYWAYLH